MRSNDSIARNENHAVTWLTWVDIVSHNAYLLERETNNKISANSEFRVFLVTIFERKLRRNVSRSVLNNFFVFFFSVEIMNLQNYG